MKLVANWQQSWKWISVQCTAGITAISLVWETMVPVEYKTAILAHSYHWAVIALALGSTFGRLIQQQQVSDGAQQAQDAMASLKAAQKEIAPIAAGQADMAPK